MQKSAGWRLKNKTRAGLFALVGVKKRWFY